MRIQTFSIVAGTRACDARCPFCVSKMTGYDEIPRGRDINARNLAKAALLAERAGTTTVLFTGKGEPTLYPDEISEYLRLLEGRPFPMMELQTNALAIGRLAEAGDSGTQLNAAHLREWYALGLDTIAVSVVDIDAEANQKVYSEDYPDLARTVGYLHEHGFSVRLCVIMHAGAVDSPERLEEVITFCRDQGVEQLTIRPVRRPAKTESRVASEWVGHHALSDAQIEAIQRWADQRGTLLMSLMHGARVYDVDGQNLCVSDCLTVEPESNDVRTLIFFSDGRVAYDWQHDGAILLGGRSPGAPKSGA